MEEAVGKSIGTFERHWNVSVGKSASKSDAGVPPKLRKCPHRQDRLVVSKSCD